MTALAKLHALKAMLSAYRFNFTNEGDLQTAIWQILSMQPYTVQREYRLSEDDRLDFLIDGEIVIETKIGGSAAAAMRQVARYAQHDTPKGFLLVTSRAVHNLPSSFNGKPCLVHSLLDGAF